MKLIYCPVCHDLVRLDYDKKSCKCKLAWGYYEDDGLNATISKGAIPIGINNQSFAKALVSQPRKGEGKRFEAFVIPKECLTVREE